MIKLITVNHKEKEGQEMQITAEQALSNLLKNSSKEKEVHFNIGKGIFRLNLKPDDMKLWGETLKNICNPGNVLLA